MKKIKVKDLDPLHSLETVGSRENLKKLTDDQLLASVEQPSRGDRLKINSKGKVVDGNGRAYELKRRATEPTSKITNDTEVSYEEYSSSTNWFFYDLED